MPSQVFVMGPKLVVHFQLVKLENGIIQIQRKMASRWSFLELDQLSDAWTDQVHPLATWTRADDQG